MINNIKISVITPIHNMKNLILDLISSYQTQTLDNTELIIIDDASTDGSTKQIREQAKKDSRIKAIFLEQNVGSGRARNIGIEQSRGEYICFADADDMFNYPYALSHLYAAAKKHQSEITAGGHNFFYKNDNQITKIRNWSPSFTYSKTTTISDRSNFPYLTIWQLCIKKSFIQNHNITFPSVIRGQDAVFLLNLLLKANRMTIIPNIVYSYRVLYRFIDYNDKRLNSTLELLKILYNLYADNNYYHPRFSAPFELLNWSSMDGYVDEKILSEKYTASKTAIDNYLLSYNQLRKNYEVETYNKSLKSPQSIIFLNYYYKHSWTHSALSVNKKGRLSYKILPTNNGNSFFCKSHYLKIITNAKIIHILGYERSYEHLIHRTNIKNASNILNEIFIFARSQDTIPFMSWHGAPAAANVLEAANLGLLNHLAKYFKHDAQIWIHGLRPRPMYIFADKNPQLWSRLNIDISEIYDMSVLMKDEICSRVIAHSKQIMYSCTSQLQQLLNALPNNSSLAERCSIVSSDRWFADLQIRSFDGARNIAIFSDSSEFTRKAVNAINNRSHHDACVSTFCAELTPRIRHEMDEALQKAGFTPSYNDNYNHDKFINFIQKCHTVFYSKLKGAELYQLVALLQLNIELILPCNSLLLSMANMFINEYPSKVKASIRHI